MTSTFEKGKTLHYQAYEIVNNMTNFFIEVTSVTSSKIPISQATKRPSEVTGMLESTIKKLNMKWSN